MRGTYLGSLAFLLSQIPFSAFAQVQYGTVAGAVLDGEGLPLPGATVTLSGPAMQGARTSVTDGVGRYLFIPVPRGNDYSLLFEAPGFATLEQTGVAVNIGKQTSVETIMGPVTFAEMVTVSAEGIVVDTTQSTLTTTVEWELLDQMTTTRHYNTAWYLDPAVPDTAQNNPSVRGAGGDDNLTLIDGVDTTDPRTMTWGTQINWDTIQEVQVQTGGHPAEFGRALGGVLNVVTKSGSNDFHFTARAVMQDSDWDAEPEFDEERGITKPAQAQTSELRPNVTLGGPIVRDRLWFYVGNEWRDRERINSAYDTYEDVLAGSLNQYTQDYEGHEGSGKLTWQVNPSHSLVAYYNEDPIEISPTRSIYQTASRGAGRQFQGSENWSLQWYGMLSPKLFLESKVQLHRQDLDSGPSKPRFGQVSSFVDRDTGFAWGAPSANYESSRDRDGVLFTGTSFLDAGASSHQLKAGVEWLEAKPKAGAVYNPAGIYRTRGTVPNSRYLYLDQVQRVPTQDTYWAGFLQDKWRIGRLTLNLGVRAEAFSSATNAGTKVVDFGFEDQIAPRLGFAYDLNGDSLHASLSRYYDVPTNYISATMSETPARLQYWTWNGNCDSSGEWWRTPDSCWTLRWDVPTQAGGFEVDPNLEPIRLDELTLGWQHKLTDLISVGANFVWRKQERGIEDIDPEYDGVFLWTNGPLERVVVEDGRVFETDDPWKDFQSIELSIAKRLSKDGFQFIASYAYVLRSRGWEGAGGATAATPYSQFSVYGDQPDAFDPRWYGDLQSPHWVRLDSSWTAPWRMTIGVGLGWNSGVLFTRTTPGDYGDVPQEDYGSSEVGDNWEGSLHVEQAAKVGPVELGLYLDVINLFDNQQPTARGGNAGNPAEYTSPTAWQTPRSFILGLKLAY